MKSSSAFGTFLRYWRSECAGLSRAQFALAVAAQCRRNRTSEAVIRAWESGQPPADTEEMDALLAVMRKHGLSEPEVGHVRRAIFAACLDRHYPELFPAEEFAEQPDVDEQAREECLRVMLRGSGSEDVVGLVARHTELARHERLTPANGTQARHRNAARAYLGIAMAYQHFGRGRSAVAAALCDSVAELVRTHFGGALEPTFTAHKLVDCGLIFGFLAAPSAAGIRALLAAAEEARARGEDLWSGNLQCEAVCYSCDFGDAALREEVRVAAHDRIAIAREHGWPESLGMAHRSEFRMALADGHLAEAEHHLALYDEYCAEPGHEIGLALCLGWLALAAHKPGEAEEQFEAALPLVREAGNLYLERLLGEYLQRLRGEADLLQPSVRPGLVAALTEL